MRLLGWFEACQRLHAENNAQQDRNPDTVRAPDIAFLRQARRPKEPDNYIQGPPDLAVEIISYFDRLGDVDDKTKQWLDAGTPLHTIEDRLDFQDNHKE